MKSILVPTDFSAASRPAMHTAVAIAGHTGARLIFFHTAYFTESPGWPEMTYNEALEESMRKAKAKLEKEVEKLLTLHHIDIKKFNPEMVVHFGPSASDDIIARAKEEKIWMVVMGTHGAGRSGHLFFGSNAAHVISSGAFPVLAVPAAYAAATPSTIYYATDLSEPMQELTRIKNFIQGLKARIELVYVDYGWARSPAETKTVNKLKALRIPLNTIEAHIETPLSEVLRKFMKGKKESLLCMFHERKKGIAAFLFGGKTKDIAKKLEFPLLSIPK